MDRTPFQTLAGLNDMGREFLPGLVGIRFTHLERGRVEAELEVEQRHLAPNRYLHAATVIALADTAAGYGCMASLPDGAVGFTTVELKSNFLATVRDGLIRTEARLRHGGRSTQVWDAEVSDAEGRTLAFFRCTQMILWPR